MNTRSLIALSSLALASFAATNASASISFVTGQTTHLGSPPLDCTIGMLTGLNAHAWDEQQGVPVLSQPVDMVNNPGTSGGAIAGSLTGIYDSHFLHWDLAAGVPSASGTVVFSAPIDGVIFLGTSLDSTDASLGAGGTLYPTTFPFRDITTSPSSFSINSNVLSFNFTISPIAGVMQVRVLTRHVPAPGAALVAGLAGLAVIRRRRLA